MPESELPYIDELVDHIDNRKGLCLLLLGPELSVNEYGVSYKKYCLEEIDGSLPTLRYVEQDNLFHGNNTDTSQLPAKLRAFYEHAGDPVFLELLSRIEFPLIINVAPDIALQKTYSDLNIKAEDGYFLAGAPKEKRLDGLEPTKTLPIVYNIFGTIENAQSIVATYPGLYKTIEYLLDKNALPEGIQRFIQTAQSYLFLGFKMDSWYYQLLCHKLGIDAANRRPAVCTPGMDEDNHVSVIMKNNFNISFSSVNSLDCVQLLLEKCKFKRPANPVSHFSTFISYAHNTTDDPYREMIVDLVGQYFMQPGHNAYTLFRDHKDVNYGASIEAFMHLIGKGKSVIMVITERFLRTEYCMTEASRVLAYNNYMQRVFFVIVSDREQGVDLMQNLDNAAVYRAFWLDALRDAAEHPKIGDPDQLNRLARIASDVVGFIGILKDKRNLLLDYQDLRHDDSYKVSGLSEKKAAEFNAFMKSVSDKLNQ